MDEEAGGCRVDGRDRVSAGPRRGSAGPRRGSAGAAFRGRLPELLIEATFVFFAVLPALVAMDLEVVRELAQACELQESLERNQKDFGDGMTVMGSRAREDATAAAMERAGGLARLPEGGSP